MTSDDFRHWHVHQGYSYDTGAAALGVSRRTYAKLMNGDHPDRLTALACAALAAGLTTWTQPKPEPRQPAPQVPQE